jgi:hypothetical protein
MKIEIVSHCYAVDLPFYAGALCHQLSSYVLDPIAPPHEVVPAVCYCPADMRTWEVISYFRSEWKLRIAAVPLSRSHLARRSIGRNVAAKTTEADIVWFADVDQVYRYGCLTKLANLEWPEGAVMIHPKEIRIRRDHATGDAELREPSKRPMTVMADPADFVPKRYKRAIGGVQIVRGDFAREHGYLDGDPKWQRPYDGSGFDSCRCDLPYRKFVQQFGEVAGVDLPGMFRLRHTEAGHGRPASKKPIGPDGVEKF